MNPARAGISTYKTSGYHDNIRGIIGVEKSKICEFKSSQKTFTGRIFAEKIRLYMWQMSVLNKINNRSIYETSRL